MMPHDLARAVRECCPKLRVSCFFALVGGCAAVNEWSRSHKVMEPPRFLFRQTAFKTNEVLDEVGP